MSTAKSVFDFMTEKDRERLQTFIATAKAANAANAQLSSQPGAAPSAKEFMQEVSTEVTIPPLSPRTAGAALRGFIPYGDDPARQERYKSYLTSQTHDTTQPDPILRRGTTEEINKELEDFAASARIFKPMSFAMSSRFTSGSASLAVSDAKQPKAGLHAYDPVRAAEAMAEREKQKALQSQQGTLGGVAEDPGRVLTSREQAAKDGRYGQLTRTVKEFYPTKLICRRFGVQDPHPEGEPKGISAVGGAGSSGLEGLPLPSNDASWESGFVHQDQGLPTAFGSASTTGRNGPGGSAEGQAEEEEEVERVPRSLADVGMPGDANQGRDTLTYTKPSIDIFKAIFASDDEDEDDNDDDDGKKEGEEDEDIPACEMLARQRKKLEDEREKARALKRKQEEEGTVDIATFKPVFSMRREQSDTTTTTKATPRMEGGSGDKEGGGDTQVTAKKQKKKDRKDKKEKRKGVLSFAADEGEDEGVWVEKVRP